MMLHSYLMAALRGMAHNPLYAVLNILGLTLGIAPALLVALFIKHELSYDLFLPHHEDVYLLSDRIQPEGKAAYRFDTSPANLAAKIKLNYPEVHSAARLASERGTARRGEVEAHEDIVWADAGLFSVLQIPFAAGDPAQALNRPDAVVLTRKAARKYFGDADPMGQTLEINRAHSLVVTAIIEDLPSNSNLRFEIIASGAAPFSRLTALDVSPPHGFQPTVYSFFRMTPGADISAMEGDLPAFLRRTVGGQLDVARAAGIAHTFSFIPLRALHLVPGRVAQLRDSADVPALYAGAVITLLIVAAAVFNFINLTTCRASLRAIEVGIRRAAGARRVDLVGQFLGETAVYAVIGTGLAALIVKMLTPALAGFLLPIGVPALDQAGDARFWLTVAACVLGLTVLAGLYPAFVLSSYRPSAVLKASKNQSVNTSRGRRFVVMLQFSILIILLVATAIAYRQVNLSHDVALRFASEQILLVRGGCRDSFQNEVARVPGIEHTACASPAALNYATVLGPVKLSDGTQVTAATAVVDFGLLDLFAGQPLAGRFFARQYGADILPPGASDAARPSVVINETAVRRFGFGAPQDALGKFIRLGVDVDPSEIVGVAPDFAFDAVTYGIQPVVYLVKPKDLQYLVVKLAAGAPMEMLDGIDAAWKASGGVGPIERTFLDQRIQWSYLGITRQSQVFGGLAAMALFISALGLFGLSALTADQRTKEIGVRKALGASTPEILGLLIWQFTKPVLWANVVAWPVAYLVMRRWLEGFAYHVDLEPWLFLGVSATAFMIAVLTVAGHAWLVARTQPVHALRYE